MAGVTSGRARLASHPARRDRHTSEAPRPLPLLHDGALSLELLARYADEYDEHAEGTTYPARAFVTFLELEHRGRRLHADMGRREAYARPNRRDTEEGPSRPL
ncbi:MAG: hypothetical protein ABI841_02895 [Chloroflexota bacterium]